MDEDDPVTLSQLGRIAVTVHLVSLGNSQKLKRFIANQMESNRWSELRIPKRPCRMTRSAKLASPPQSLSEDSVLTVWEKTVKGRARGHSVS